MSYNRSHKGILLLTLLFFSSTLTIAQTITGAVPFATENFEVNGTNWPNAYTPDTPTCYQDNSYVWAIVDSIGYESNRTNIINSGTSGPNFWGAWQIDSMACGATVVNPLTLSFPSENLPLNATLAELCFDYNIVAFNGPMDYIELVTNLDGATERNLVIQGGIDDQIVNSDGWLRYCTTFCLGPSATSSLSFDINVAVTGEEGWAGIDNVRLFTSMEIDNEEKACFGLPLSNEILTCNEDSVSLRLSVRPGDKPRQASWEIRDGEGNRIHYVNADALYQENITYKHNIKFAPCETYTFEVFDSGENGWKLGGWTIEKRIFGPGDLNRGLTQFGSLSNIVPHIAWGDGRDFTDQRTYTISLPCLPTCPETQIVESTPGAACQILNYVPPNIDAPICPNTCIEPVGTRVHFIEADTTINLPTLLGVDLEVGQHLAVYEIIYEDGQITRCTTTVTVFVELNPSILCNNDIQVSISPDDKDNCELEITPDMLLEDFISCSNEYQVVLYNENGMDIGSSVGPSEAGTTVTYTVTHSQSQNFCWGSLFVEDKAPPRLTCTNDIISCNSAAIDPFFDSDRTQLFKGLASELPANIAGGSANNPSITSLALFADMGHASLGEIVTEVSLNLRIRHSDIEDLSAYLIAPNGMSIQLLDHPCRDTDNQDIEAIFTDMGLTYICVNDTLAMSGMVKPKEDNGQIEMGFSKLNGIPLRDIQGHWLLTIYDNSNETGPGDNEVGQGELQVANLSIRSAFRDNHEVFDCSGATVEMIGEEFQDLGCGEEGSFGAQIVRIWQAEDAFGNISTCEQIVYLETPTFNMLFDSLGNTIPTPNLISLPADVTINQCNPNADTSIDVRGEPTFDGNPVLPEHHSFCDFSYTYSDETSPLCGEGFELRRTWAILDWCSGLTFYHTQLITMVDKTMPVINNKKVDFEVFLDSFSCTGNLIVPSVLSDVCSEVTQFFASYEIDGVGIHNDDGTAFYVDLMATGTLINDTLFNTLTNLPIGNLDITFKAIDECGNLATKIVRNIAINDNIPPVVICKDPLLYDSLSFPSINISVSSDTTKLFIEHIDLVATDNCSEVVMDMRRLGGCLGNSAWADEVEVACCDQAFNPIIVEIRVSDEAGNSTVCIREIYVEDPHAPTLEYCPPNDTLSCEAIFEVEDAINSFGTPVFDDNCEDFFVDAFTSTQGFIDTCRAGHLRRKWIASDLSPKSPDTFCVQQIVVMHQSDFIVRFPKDTLITDCPNELVIIGEPDLLNIDCELVDLTYEDVVYNVVPDACYKIERHWKAINWCLFNGAPTTGTGSVISLPIPRTFQDDNVGIIEYTQTIKVLDNEPPVFNCTSDTVFCINDTSCEADVALRAPVSDNCSPLALEYLYQVDVDNDGSYELSDTKKVLIDVLPIGTHSLTWTVEDGCGNSSTCAHLITVEDCTPPSLVCLHGLSLPTEIGNCTPVWASDLLEYATDNCSADSFVENTVKIRKQGAINSPSGSILFCCNDVGSQTIEVWVSDEAGNSTFCLTTVEVQDNTGDCDAVSEMANIAGRIHTSSGDWVEAVALQLTGNMELNLMNGELGTYQFNQLPTFENYSIHVSKEDNPINGVSTFDLVLINQHILGISPLLDPYQLIAADINNDGNISTFDIVQLRQLILFLIQDFPTNTSWRFVDAAYMFPDPLNPWQEAFPQYIDFSPLHFNELNADFMAIKVGDIDGNAIPNSLIDVDNRTTKQQAFMMDAIDFVAGESIHIPFVLSDLEGLAGLQFTLQFDSEKLSYQSYKNNGLHLSDANLNTHQANNGLIHISWDNINELSIDHNEQTILFELIFKAKANSTLAETISLSERHIAPEMYLENEGITALRMDFNQEDNPIVETILYPNTPNPFSDKTAIQFYIPANQTKATFRIFSLNGKVIYDYEGLFQEGIQTITIPAAHFPSNGVYYYQLATDNFTATKSMISVK